jgi:hypothetical protein
VLALLWGKDENIDKFKFQIKTWVSYQYTPLEWLQFKRKNLSWMRDIWSSHHIVDGNAK